MRGWRCGAVCGLGRFGIHGLGQPLSFSDKWHASGFWFWKNKEICGYVRVIIDSGTSLLP